MKADKVQSGELYLAVSFSGEDRAYVDEIVKELAKYIPRDNIFYDTDYSEILSGKDLFEYLRDVYAEKSKYVMCFFSKNYTQSNWANVEASAIKDRLFMNFMDSSFLIPIVLDNSPRFLPATIGFWAKDKFSVQEIAEMTFHKITTGESLNLSFPNISDLEDLAFTIKNTFCERLTTLNKKFEYNLTDEGFCISVDKGDCTVNFAIEYKACGLRALLLRITNANCSARKIPQYKNFSPLTCNAFVTNYNATFTIHNFDLFDTENMDISGNDAVDIITKKFLEKLNEGCRCLF